MPAVTLGMWAVSRILAAPAGCDPRDVGSAKGPGSTCQLRPPLSPPPPEIIARGIFAFNLKISLTLLQILFFSLIEMQCVCSNRFEEPTKKLLKVTEG